MHCEVICDTIRAGARRWLMDQKEVLDVEEAATLLGISRWTVRALAKDGKLPARKLGKEWRFSRQALLRYLGGDLDDRKEAAGE